jgi:hypothetical protein
MILLACRRAFTYAVDGRGQQLFSLLGLMPQLQARAMDSRWAKLTLVGTDGKVTMVILRA